MRAEPFQEALSALKTLGAERILVLQGPEPLKLRASYGIRDELPWTDQVSLSLLEKSLAGGECLLLGDAQTSPLAERWSLAVSEIRSVLCVPFWSPSSRIVGILYADTLSKAGVFSRKALETMQTCARNLERALYGGSQAPLPTTRPEAPAPRPMAASGSLGLKPATPQVRASQPKVKAEVGGTPDARAVTIFYRSLATMVAAGLPITRSLDILAHHSDDPAMQSINRELARRVSAGNAISVSMSAFPAAFSRFETRLVHLAERTGSLHAVLANLAEHREKSHAVALKIKSALAYPAMILVVCLLLLTVGPAYLLEGQFRLIRESRQPIPWITQALMTFSEAVRSPLGLAILLGVALTGLLGARAVWSNPALRQRLQARAGRLPGLGPALINLATARFCRSLALSYRVGLPVTEGLLLAAQNSENAVLESSIGEAVERLKNGATLAQCLDSLSFFPRLMVHSLKAAEESGNIDGMMNWTARLYEVELESSLQSFLSLIEPVLMLGMGILVGLVLLATLLPMVNVLQSL
ncbi:MAG: type II secretion system F family protein [Vulcanimicrobiota bacterium]